MSGGDPTGRFGERAEAYGRHRPGYPVAVFDLLLAGLGDPACLAVADVGAGTGISTRLLAARVGRVFAVEPNAAMRAEAEAPGNVVWLAGTAEATGLPTHSVDVAAAFQAFHWFDADRALAEFRRIACRRIALVQYERDEREPFARAYGDLIRPFLLDDTEARRLRALVTFAEKAGSNVQQASIPFGQSLDLEGVMGLIASSSYLPREGAAADRLRAGAAQLFQAFALDGRVELARSVYVLTQDLD
ncbi:MAG TPA: class I SAM-dependent methyltransferase [Holophagaceae bacterium]